MASPILKNTLEVDLKNKNNKTKQKYRKISKTRWCKGPPVLSLDFSRNTSSYRDKSTSEGCAQLHNVLGSSKESKGLLQLQSLRSLQREMVFLVTNTTFRTWCFSENNKEGCSHTHTHTQLFFCFELQFNRSTTKYKWNVCIFMILLAGWQGHL